MASAFLHTARERDEASGSALTKMEPVELRSYSPPANVPPAVMDSNRILFCTTFCVNWITLSGRGLVTSTSPVFQKSVIERQVRPRLGIAAGIVGSSLHRRIFQGE
jgi:hypothetical protein